MYRKVRAYFIGDLIKGKNVLDTARIKIILDLIIFAALLTLVIAVYTFLLGHTGISLRASVSVVLMLGVAFLIRRVRSIQPAVHILMILTAFAILSNIYIIFQVVDYSTIALYFTLVIFGFYFLSFRWAFIYSLAVGIGLLSVMYMNSIGMRWVDQPPQSFSPQEQALAFVVVLVLLTYLLVQFQRANDHFNTHLEESNQALQSAKDAAEQLSRLKSAFLANMSHEIRTPLNGIIGISEIIASKTSDEEIQGMIRMQMDSSNRLLNTITGILKLSKLESDLQDLALSRVEVNGMLRSSLELLKPLADKKGLEVRMHLAAEDLYCNCTEDILFQILNNIIGNAIKFTDTGRVELHSGLAGEMIEVRIRDTGIGIATEFLPKVFNEFEQESSGIGRDYEGSGLGLSISRKYIELVGGDIEVESEKGKGTEFRILIPSAGN